MQQAIFAPSHSKREYRQAIPVYPIKAPELTTSEKELQDGLELKAWWKIHGITQQVLKKQLESKTTASVADRVKSAIAQKADVVKTVANKILEEKALLQSQINEIESWRCEKFFREMRTSNQRFELEALDRCLKLLESL